MAAPPSSTALWATASKDWVIQPKPKPGRKPKKDSTNAVTTVEDPDGKGRRVQNRAAQRAFRERKQSQLAELQARVQSYEQGEIERNVALQNIAKRLKEENEVLRRENNLLRERIAIMEKEQQVARDKDKKRWRDDSPTSSISSSSGSRKRPRIDSDAHEIIPHMPTSFSSASPPSMVSSPDSNASSEAPFSPIPMETHLSSAHIPTIIDLSNAAKSDNFDTEVFRGFGCGFCTEGTTCVCREAFRPPADPMVTPTLKVEAYEQPNPPALIRIGSPAPPSVLDNLPAYQPPVPLRRKTGSTSNNANPIFSATVPQSKPTCSGDPSNCLACADDSFGKAFCAALGRSIAEQASTCPCPPEFSNDLTAISFESSDASSQETIPTNDAWRQLKSHPNVAFSDLALLADVVARRSKCTGPRVVISPAPGTVTPERMGSPANPGNDSESVLLTDPHAHYREKERTRSTESPPRLVPQEVLVRCGQDRVREVQAAGVRDALRLLDSKFSMS